MIGERLRKLRKENGIKQEELAAIIGVQKSAVSLYETNKNDPGDKIKFKIAQYFNVSLDYLLGLIDEQVPHYNDKLFLRLPEDITDEETALLTDFLEFVMYKRNRQDTPES